MSSNPKGTGADYLVRKSDLAKSGKDLQRFQDIVIMEDEALASDRLLATMRTLYGYDPEVRRASTLNKGLDLMIAKQPDLVLLDDYLGLTDTAIDSIPMIRHTGFRGPIVVISGRLDRKRRALLLSKGADGAINKDDLDTGSLAEELITVAKRRAEAKQA
jgi:DNA-binding NarL/FixJ family response regulator